MILRPIEKYSSLIIWISKVWLYHEGHEGIQSCDEEAQCDVKICSKRDRKREGSHTKDLLLRGNERQREGGRCMLWQSMSGGKKLFRTIFGSRTPRGETAKTARQNCRSLAFFAVLPRSFCGYCPFRGFRDFRGPLVFLFIFAMLIPLKKCYKVLRT